MAVTRKTDKSLIAKLQSGKSSLIHEGIEEVKIRGTAGIIPYLFDIVAEGKDEKIVEEIIRMIGDIKEKDAVPYIVESLQKHNFGKHRAEIIAACWQSSLDFSPFIQFYTSFFIEADYQTALEAFTVIEGSVFNAEIAKRNECLKILDSAIHKISEEKKSLFLELYKMIKSSLEFSIDN